MPPRTLERALSKAGAGSRTQAREWIESGRVSVNGRVVRDPGTWVDPERDRLGVDGEPLQAAPPTYLLLHKPKGIVTTRRDPQGRPTVCDLLQHHPGGRGHVVPVGRLDRDTSGLLVMTNDTQLAEHLTSPHDHVPKTYLVKASRRLTEEQLDALRHGIQLRDGPTRPAQVEHLRNPGGRTVFTITLTEGRNRQVRRMVEALGAKVVTLVRTAIGPLELRDMQPGDVRELDAREVQALRDAGRPAGGPRPRSTLRGQARRGAP